MGTMPDAVQAFDATADQFDQRFGTWRSVVAQRDAVRRALLGAFPPGSSLIELGAGTGEDAAFLAQRHRRVVLTDGSPRMCAVAAAKLAQAGCSPRTDVRCVTFEAFPAHAAQWAVAGEMFDGAFSNFAGLNCINDLGPVARGLARVLRPGGRALVVLFGSWSPGEVVVELLRGRPHHAVRRFTRGPVAARLGGRAFTVRYPAPRQVARECAPWFRLERTRGVGIFVPPSAAEPWISRAPRLVAALALLDRLAARPLARLGDHVLLDLVRTEATP
jgi:ubiquinone/menaquinone biosynthesis C-methylase UbiE